MMRCPHCNSIIPPDDGTYHYVKHHAATSTDLMKARRAERLERERERSRLECEGERSVNRLRQPTLRLDNV